MTEDAIQQGWHQWLTDLLNTQRTPEFGERFAKFCPYPGANPQDYWPCEIQLEPDFSVIAGINEHYGFFVRVYAQNRILGEDEYLAVGRKLLERFRVFDPAGVRWWFAASGGSAIATLKSYDETCLVVGHLPTLESSLPAPVGVMRRVTELDPSFYAAYVAIYERFYAMVPSMKAVVRTESNEALSLCAQSGMLYAYEVEREIVGVFACRLGVEPPISGWCVVEAILDTPYRGRGLAAPALLYMLRKLEHERSELAFATIAGVNEPSLQTALRVGLRVVGRWKTLCE